MDIEVLNGRRITKKQWPLLWLRVKDPEISKDHSKSLIKIEYGNDFICLGAYIFPEKRQDLAYEIKCARNLALN
jgi:hypothetical protein